MAQPTPPDESERKASIEREAAALGITVTELYAERALRRSFEPESSLGELIHDRQSYLDGCRNSEIDDTLDNIRCIEFELHWLERIQSSPELLKLWRDDLDACFAELRKP